MKDTDRKSHWEKIYQTKALEDVSWFQSTPETSLRFFEEFEVSKTSKIIDVGGGDSLLVDHLLDRGYEDITVLDISAAAIDRAKQRLGDRAKLVKWIVSDVTKLQTKETYEFWHDRATFHFLTEESDILSYIETAHHHIKSNGIMIIGTFSESGPTKCSGIQIQQYSEHSLTDRLKSNFEKLSCLKVDHKTPSESVQNFVFCSFKRL